MTEKDLWKEAIRSGRFGILVSGSAYLVPGNEAVSFIDWVNGRNKFLGLEGFKLEGEHVVPMMDHIIDFSGSHGTAEDLKKILQSKSWEPAPDYVEFILQ